MKTKEPAWDLYSAAILAVFCFFQVMQWPLLPKFMDIYYHLFVMKGFAQAGGYVTRSFWEYAPVGRPHLYPPFLHLLMLGLYKLGLSEMTIARLVECALYPAVLAVQWVVLKRLFNSRIAFFVTVIFSSVYSLTLATVILSPFSLAYLVGLLALLSLEKGKVLFSGLLLALCFYTHTWMAWTLLLTVLFYGVLRREKRKEAVFASLIAVTLALPFLIFQFSNRAFFSFIKTKENLLLEIDPSVYCLAIFGAVTAFRKKGPALLAFCLVLATLPLSVTHRFRFFSGHGLVGWIWLAGFAADEIFCRLCEVGEKRKWGLAWLLIFTLFFSLAAPTFFYDLKEHKNRLVFFNRSMSQYLTAPSDKNFRAKGFTIYFEKEYNEIVRIVLAHTEKGDILWSNFNHGGGLIALLSDRATSSAMLQEVKPYRPFDEIRAARLLIWFKEPDGDLPKDMERLIKKYQPRPVAETDFVYIYENLEGFSKSRPLNKHKDF